MITGNLVTLSKPQKEDMTLLLEWRNDPNNRKYFRDYRETNLEDQLNWYENVMMKDPTWHHFIVKPILEPNKVIGVVLLNHIHPIYRTGEFGITLVTQIVSLITKNRTPIPPNFPSIDSVINFNSRAGM